MSQSAQLFSQAFDPVALEIIELRRPIVQAHLARWRTEPAALTLNSAVATPDWLVQLEHKVTRISAHDFDERSRGRDSWRDQFLLPLAGDLDLVQVAETTTLRQMYRIGSFDVLDLAISKYQHPAEQVIETVRSLLQSVPHQSHRMSQLVARELCHDKEVAKLVVEAWRRVEQHAAGLARRVVLAYLAHGDVGLLVSSEYQHTDELLLLQSHRERVAEVSSAAIWLQLHQDVVALANAWAIATPKGWCIRLLSEPRNSEYRRRVAQALGTHRRARAVQTLVEQHSYPSTEAQALVEHLLNGGLSELVAYRSCVGDDQALLVERYEQLQLRRILRDNYAALDEENLAYIETLVFHLYAAIRRSGVPFPLVPLLTERPSSARRMRVSRRFRFGLAAIIQRRKQKRRRRAPQPRNKSQTGTTRQPAPATALIQIFAELSNLDDREAEACLRELITYGALGLLPRAQRMRCLDPQLYSWLRLIKYGRLEGRVPWPRVMAQLDIYRRMLGLPNAISPLLSRAVFNAIPRPAFWHGGQGEATVRLHQRGTLTLKDAQRLHERWLVIALSLPLSLCDTLGHSIGSGSHVVLVIEANGLFPLAACVTAETPTVQAVSLALYQAIWHPGAENWPVKGIPEQIIVSEELLIGERSSLEQACDYLLSDLLPQPRVKLVKGALGKLLKTIEQDGFATITDGLRPDERTPSRVVRLLEEWILKKFFPYHTPSPVWQEIARHGVVMPGHDTPAAGWLLPISCKSTIAEGNLEHEGYQYRVPCGVAVLEAEVAIRQFPLLLTSAKRAIASDVFVETQSSDGVESALWYAPEYR